MRLGTNNRGEVIDLDYGTGKYARGIRPLPEKTDPRAEDSGYLPFDVKIGKAKDFPDTKEGRKKILDALRPIREKYNPAGKGYGIGDE